jgi:hypothetical protein
LKAFTSNKEATVERPSRVAWTPAGAVGVLLVGLLSSSTANAVPSFARQTGLACQACHTVFPELTPFGRTFKLNAYQIDNLPQIQGINPNKEYELLLNQVPAFSLMFQTSYTRTSSALPDSTVSGAKSQDGQVLFPQQASLFYAGRIAPNLGAFIQMTYDSAAGNFHWDNTEFRYAKQIPSTIGPLTVGLTLNNNPTVQDPWNSTPAWQTPFDQKTSAAPVPGTAAKIDGVLGGGVAGITGYLWWNNSVYAEVGVYRSSPQGFKNANGFAGPLDSTAGGTLSSGAPYWRIAYERQWNRHSWSIGAYGMVTRITPGTLAVGSASDKFTDTALDSQYQFIGDEHIFSVQTTYIKETQALDATFGTGGSSNSSDDLKTFRLGGSYYYRRTYGGGLGYFSTMGSTDALRYAPAVPSVVGFANGSPNSNGWIGELDYLPWQNVKIALQYTAYHKFNGSSTNYDGMGRDASANNTLYLLGWFTF